MADITPVAFGSKPPDVIGKLSGLLSLQQQQQAIQGQAAQVQQEQQTARQRAALAKYDWNQHMGQDGTIDINSVVADPKFLQAAGDQAPEVLGKIATVKNQQMDAKSKLVSLRNDQRSAFGQLIGGLRQDPDVAKGTKEGRQKVNEALTQYSQMYGDDVLPVVQAYSKPLSQVPDGKLPDALKSIQMQAVSASEQGNKQNPQYVNTGTQLQNTNTTAIPGQSSAPLQVNIPPGFHSVTDPRTGNPYLVNDQTGEVRDLGQGYPGRGSAGVPPGASPGAAPQAPSQAPPQAPPTNSLPKPFYPGQAHDIGNQQEEVKNIRATADQAPINKNIYQHILKLNDDTKSGPAVAFLQKNPVISQMFGDNYQEMSKYLEKNAIANMAAMGGPPSDARLSAAAAANGGPNFNPKALKAVTEFNYATNTALDKFRQGVDKAVGTKNPDYTALPEFKSQWAQNFDVNVFRLENAIADGNDKEKKEILNGLTAQQAAALIQKRKSLDSLAKTGHLPQ